MPREKPELSEYYKRGAFVYILSYISPGGFILTRCTRKEYEDNDFSNEELIISTTTHSEAFNCIP